MTTFTSASISRISWSVSEPLGIVLGASKEMHVKVLQNLVSILSERVVEANQHSESQAREIGKLSRELGIDEDDDDD